MVTRGHSWWLEVTRVYFWTWSEWGGQTRDPRMVLTLLLSTKVPAVSALMGNSTVEIFENYEERVNLYMLALGGPSTGKTQSHKNCITQPILKEDSVVNCFLRMQAWKVCLSSFRVVKIAQLCVPSMNVKNSSRRRSDSKRVPRLRRWNDYYCVMTVLTGMKWKEIQTKGFGFLPQLWFFLVLRNHILSRGT